MAKDTGNLLKILNNSKSVGDYLAKEEAHMIKTTLSEELLKYIKEKDTTASSLFKTAGIDKSYGYEIINGTKRPTRDKVLRLLIALNLSQDEAQSVLKATGYPALYPKDERDTIILFALNQGGDINNINDTLYDMGFDTLN